MNDIAIFSISTSDYLTKGSVALQSLSSNLTTPVDIFNFSLEDMVSCKDRKIQDILHKYKNKGHDSIRWSLKPAIILYLLNYSYKKCIYIDNDIFFVNNADFLINSLNGALLTPHFRPLLPSANKKIHGQFSTLFTDGFFNAGFIASDHKGLPAIEWWHNMVSWRCEKNTCSGLFDDQKYLDIMCLEFSNIVHICRHLGCNIAEWNDGTYTVDRLRDKWVINDKYDPIFFHFSKSAYGSSWLNQNPMVMEYYQKFLDQEKEQSK